MSLGGSLKVIGAGLVFRSAGAEGAGYTLLDAFSGDDEQEKMLAGISLVKAGERSINLIENAGKTGRLTPDVVRLLADIGGSRSRALLGELSGGEGLVATAATESLQVLDQIEAAEGD
ncbi:MAG TPA: hypothetical protein VNT92_02685 [Acidimicrobiia bacterium]|nr:hypothetical protein [Acidimicrobiia bacterium]